MILILLYTYITNNAFVNSSLCRETKLITLWFPLFSVFIDCRHLAVFVYKENRQSKTCWSNANKIAGNSVSLSGSQDNILNSGKFFIFRLSSGFIPLLWEWSDTGKGCPQRLWSLHPWAYSKPSWTQSWTTCCSWSCSEQGRVEQTTPPHLIHSLILQFIYSWCLSRSEEWCLEGLWQVCSCFRPSTVSPHSTREFGALSSAVLAQDESFAIGTRKLLK